MFAICLTSHNRIHCAKINQEIIRLNYKTPFIITHASSGAVKERYLEDSYEWCEPKPMHSGAIHLLQRSFALASKFSPDYLVHLEADTWLLDENTILRYIRAMEENPQLLLATSAWSPKRTSPLSLFTRYAEHSLKYLLGLPLRTTPDIHDFSTQFFIIRHDKKLMNLIASIRPDEVKLSAEQAFYNAFTKGYGLDRVLRMKEREPVHPDNRYASENLALYCQHWPAAGTANDPRSKKHPLYVHPTFMGKKEALLKYPLINKGEEINRLLQATSYDYYNPGAIRY